MSLSTLCGLDGRSIDVHARPGRCRHVVDDLPRGEHREYHVWDLVAALYEVDSAGRYRRREEAQA